MRPQLSLLILLLTAPLLAASEPASQPATTAAAPAGCRLIVAHPSLDNDGLYTCLLSLPADMPINEAIGFALVLVDRKSVKVGRVSLAHGIVAKDRLVEFRLNKELIKNSFVVFQLRGEGDQPARIVQAHPGDEKTVRREGDKIIKEPIE